MPPLKKSSLCFPSSDKDKRNQLTDWACSLEDRFSSFFDSLLYERVYSLLGAAHSSFIKERSLHFLKRLALTQYFLEKRVDLERQPQSRIFLFGERICVSLCLPEEVRSAFREDIIELINRRLFPLVEVEFSRYEWISPLLQSSFFYVELEKMRGKKVSFENLKSLERFLTKKVKNYSLGEVAFWPYNHEEAYKQILSLAKEVSSSKDYPQVSIHLQKQNLASIEFAIHIVRPRGRPKAKFIDGNNLPLSVGFTSLLRETLRAKVICLAEVFSLTLPMKEFRIEGAVNFLLARERISNLLRNEVGVFRDYNGGLFEKQKEIFRRIVEKFSDKIPQLSLFAQKLFYSIVPVEAQFCLDDSLWEELLMGFSHAIRLDSPFSGEISDRLSILKRGNIKDLEPFLEKAQNLSKKGKIIAYLACELLSESYLLILSNEKTPGRSFYKKPLSKEKILRLSFETPSPPLL